MFKALDEAELNIVIDAMEEKKFDAGQTVIAEGENGTVLYVIESGTLDCFKMLDSSTEPTWLKMY